MRRRTIRKREDQEQYWENRKKNINKHKKMDMNRKNKMNNNNNKNIYLGGTN